MKKDKRTELRALIRERNTLMSVPISEPNGYQRRCRLEDVNSRIAELSIDRRIFNGGNTNGGKRRIDNPTPAALKSRKYRALKKQKVGKK